MLKNLINEAKILFELTTDGPLLINSPASSKIDPTLPDMSFVRCMYNEVQTVYLPGSSLKGVFRSRYEQLMRGINRPVCNLFEKNSRCSDLVKPAKKDVMLDGTQKYEQSCSACRLFGNLTLSSRITFADAFPKKGSPVELGMRNGVGINRITGAANSGALFDIEVVEQATFTIEIKLVNFALYQLRAIVWIMQDINDGMCTLGMGGSRGNGKMITTNLEQISLNYRFFSSEHSSVLRGYASSDRAEKIELEPWLFGSETTIMGLCNILQKLGIDNAEQMNCAMDIESWSNVHCRAVEGRK